MYLCERSCPASGLMSSTGGADDCTDERIGRSIVSARGARTVALTCALLLVSIGCAVKPGSEAGGVNPIYGGGISNDFDALAMVDPDVRSKVEDCIDNANFKIYTGDAYWQSTWVDAGESEAGLRRFCEKLASRDPAAFDKIHTDWVAWEAFVAAHPAQVP